jgi:allophanate hydrolase subunit 2
LQQKAIERNIHFAQTIREYKNAVKKNLKIVEHVNAIIFQNKSQYQSQSQKSTFSISSKSDRSEKRQYSCEVMHD